MMNVRHRRTSPGTEARMRYIYGGRTIKELGETRDGKVWTTDGRGGFLFWDRKALDRMPRIR